MFFNCVHFFIFISKISYIILGLAFSLSSYSAPITVTDIAGRTVSVNAPVSKVMLADSRVLVALNILHPQTPLKGIIAWDDALIKKAPDLSAAYGVNFPELKDIPVFPNPYTTDFSVEKALIAQPDLLIFDIGLQSKLTESGTLSLLEKSGLPVIFIDFRQYPLKNTVPSMQLLGRVFGEEKYLHAAEKAYQFIEKNLTDNNGRLMVRWRDGETAGNGKIDDYAFYAWALIEMYQSTLNIEYLKRTCEISRVMCDRFFDEENGGFYLYDYNNL